jgi:hypothetical protein
MYILEIYFQMKFKKKIWTKYEKIKMIKEIKTLQDINHDKHVCVCFPSIFLHYHK